MNIVFLGTPEFSIPSLEAIYNSRHKIIGIVSQPDREIDRNKNYIFSPVKNFAVEKNINLMQFEKISRDGVDMLKNLKPDIMVTVSYGQILSQQIIDIPKYGIINVHASLLPDYRGASPIQTAIIKGETVTGVTIMKTEAGLDTGDIILAESIDIGENETAGELSIRLADLGAKLLIQVLNMFEEGLVEYTKQPHVDAIVTKRISKEEGKIIWKKSAKQLKCQILGQNPSPIAFSYLNGEIVKIYRAEVALENSTSSPVGTILSSTSAKNGILVQCGTDVLKITQLQFPNKKVVSAADAINGRKIIVGNKFTDDLV